MRHDILKAAYLLNKHPLVINAKARYYYIEVRYVTGITEYWRYRKGGAGRLNTILVPDKNFIDKQIRIYRQFESNPFDDPDMLMPFFAVQGEDMAQSFFGKQLVVQELLNSLLEEGWIEPQYPDHIIRRDVDRMSSISHDRYHQCGALCLTTGREFPGKLTLEHFNTLGESYEGRRALRSAWKDVITLYKSIRMSTDQNKTLTRSRLIKNIYSCNSLPAGPRIIDPNFYVALFRDLGISAVYDMDLWFGGKALACHVLGINYDAEDSSELTEYLKLKPGNNPIVVDDGRFKRDRDPREMAATISEVTNLGIFVPKQHIQDMKAIRRPNLIIDIADPPIMNVGAILVFNSSNI